jgi:hypothetical protein
LNVWSNPVTSIAWHVMLQTGAMINAIKIALTRFPFDSGLS